MRANKAASNCYFKILDQTIENESLLLVGMAVLPGCSCHAIGRLDPPFKDLLLVGTAVLPGSVLPGCSCHAIGRLDPPFKDLLLVGAAVLPSCSCFAIGRLDPPLKTYCWLARLCCQAVPALLLVVWIPP